MSRVQKKRPAGEQHKAVLEEATDAPEGIPDAGTGQRFRQLEMFDPTVARVFQLKHSQQCEQRVQTVIRGNPNTGIRLAKAIPPYLKWPIWPAKPRRPRVAPHSPAPATAIKTFPVIVPAKKRQKAAIQAVPADRPSILSSKLNAFVTPTTQKSVRTIPRIGNTDGPSSTPFAITTPLAMIWPKSFE